MPARTLAHTPKHLSANTAGVAIKAGKGVLGRVVVNKAGATGNLLSLYDGADSGGTLLAAIDTTVVAERDYDIAFTLGLFAVLASGTAGDLTVTYL